MLVTVPFLVLLGLAIAFIFLSSQTKKEDLRERKWISETDDMLAEFTLPDVAENKWIVCCVGSDPCIQIFETYDEADNHALDCGLEEHRAFVVNSQHEVVAYHRFGREQKLG